MESWPTTKLPDPSEQYSTEVSPSVVRTEMDSGFQRQRKRFSQDMTSIGVVFSFTPTQYALFQAWWKFKISSGADWFLMSVNIGGATGTQQVRFSSPYSGTYGGGRWKVKAVLELYNVSPMSESALNAALTS